MSRIGEPTKRPWRRKTFIWMFSALAAASALIYWEQTALLYVLSTLAMCVLLLVVAFSNLEGRDRELNKNSVESDRAPLTRSEVVTSSSSPNCAQPQPSRSREGAA